MSPMPNPFRTLTTAPDLTPPTRLPWMDEASCAQIGADLWFPEQSSDHGANRAKEVCLRCPVQAECLEHALAHDERYGIWGGLTPHERRDIGRGRRMA